ncbi:MAG: DUF1638 domain-containing protein [Actinobacteria bacterium]|nr:DUF1638 domain-containing protein [Actinomycetota bacterium]
MEDAPSRISDPPGELAPPFAPGPGPGAVILACEMIEDEVGSALELAAARDGRDASAAGSLVWIESGLHERPEKLRDHIQLLVDRLDEAAETGTPAELPSVRPGMGPAATRGETVIVPPPGAASSAEPGRDILLALGYCGNGLQGLVSRHHRLVFPRVDDCISLFLNHGCTREEIVRDAHAFYLTKGWLCHDNPVQESLEMWTERFGAEKARQLRKTTLAAYERVTLIDTGAYDVAATLPESHAFARDLDLEHTETPGSIVLLERLFAGPWDSEIVVVTPGEAITILHLFEA